MKLGSSGLMTSTFTFYLLSYFISSATFSNKSIVQCSKISFIDKSIVSQYEQGQPPKGAAMAWDLVCGKQFLFKTQQGLGGLASDFYMPGNLQMLF